MTENEAKTNLELVTNKWESAEEMFSDSMDIIIDQEFVNTLYIAIKALVELPQYRAIGTVEELRQYRRLTDRVKAIYGDHMTLKDMVDVMERIIR